MMQNVSFVPVLVLIWFYDFLMGLHILPTAIAFQAISQLKFERDGILYGPSWDLMARKKKHTGRETARLSKMLNSIKGTEKRHSLVVLFPKEKKPIYSPYFPRFHSYYIWALYEYYLSWTGSKCTPLPTPRSTMLLVNSKPYKRNWKAILTLLYLCSADQIHLSCNSDSRSLILQRQNARGTTDTQPEIKRFT